MVGLLLRAAITALALWVASQLLPGIHFATTGKLVLAAVLLGLVNAVVRPIAFVLTLPITVVTLGLFLLVLNAGMIHATSRIIAAFSTSRTRPSVTTVIGSVSTNAIGRTTALTSPSSTAAMTSLVVVSK